jgi:hypothetical protein
MNLISLVQNEFIKPLVTLIIPGGVFITPVFAFLYCQYPSISKALQSTKESESQAGIIIFLLLVCALAVGLIIEDLGSRVESLLRNICKRNMSCDNSERRNTHILIEFLIISAFVTFFVYLSYLINQNDSVLASVFFCCGILVIVMHISNELLTIDNQSNQNKDEFDDKWHDYLNIKQEESVLNLKFELSMSIALISSSLIYFLMVRKNELTLNLKLCEDPKSADYSLCIILAIIGIYLLREAYSSVKSLHKIRKHITETEEKPTMQEKSNTTFSLISVYSGKVRK